jgi:DNA polymerase-3 subunit delta
LCSKELITPELIEKHVGISKDFNNFELINAIGYKNKNKSIQIINYLTNNSKNNPIILTISSLFQFFKKLLLFHGVSEINGRHNISSTLGINPYFIKDYEKASKFYNMKNCSHAIDLIHNADLKSKGIVGNNEGHKDILIDLINDLFNT